MTNKDDEILLEHISEPISEMEPGDETDCKGLIAPVVWNDTPPRERRHAFGRPVSRFVAQGKVPLKFAGFNRARHNLYRKINK